VDGLTASADVMLADSAWTTPVMMMETERQRGGEDVAGRPWRQNARAL
jgi:hypothetical protein